MENSDYEGRDLQNFLVNSNKSTQLCPLPNQLHINLKKFKYKPISIKFFYKVFTPRAGQNLVDFNYVT